MTINYPHIITKLIRLVVLYSYALHTIVHNFLYTRYPILARALVLASGCPAFRPHASKGILFTIYLYVRREKQSLSSFLICDSNVETEFTELINISNLFSYFYYYSASKRDWEFF